MAKRRVPQILSQTGGVDQIRIAAERRAELAADLRALQRVGEPGPREITRADLHHLRLGRQPAQGRGMQDPGPIPLERPAPDGAWRAGPVGWLGPPAGRGVRVVARACRHLLSLPPADSRTTARPASSRATGTRNGEQDT